ncbi:MAG: hypothetical protein MHM6MM_006972, partial [Cercozoa sp. M6MM]
GVPTEELCARWQALGHFYTFSRNHNAIHLPPQWPYLWDQVARVTRRVGHLKYSLLDYYNTLFFRAHTLGGTVLDPVWMHFGDEQETWELEEQFMVGDAILVSPVMHEGATSVSVYLPRAVWYDLMTPGAVLLGRGHRRSLDARLPENPIHVHVRGGSILPRRDTAGIMNTADWQQRPVQYHVFTGDDGAATGSLFLDDGLDVEAGREALEVTLRAALKSRSFQFVARPTQSNYSAAQTMPLEAVVVTFVDTTEELCDSEGLTGSVNNRPKADLDFTTEYFAHTRVCQLTVRDLGVSVSDSLVLDLQWN